MPVDYKPYNWKNLSTMTDKELVEYFKTVRIYDIAVLMAGTKESTAEHKLCKYELERRLRSRSELYSKIAIAISSFSVLVSIIGLIVKSHS